MNKAELKAKFEEIDKESKKKKIEATMQYCVANNPYKIGDRFTDHISTIIIEKISYYLSTDNPCCIYYGANLTKSCTVNKKEPYRSAYQSNEVVEVTR